MTSSVTEDIVPNKWKLSFREGQMNPVVRFLDRLGVRRQDFMKSGSTCIVYNYHETNNQGSPQVLKLCTKRIDYFNYHRSTVKDFKTLIDKQFSGNLLPISEILYEDPHYFVYAQEKIKILDFSQVDCQNFIIILEIIKKMFVENIITPDFISSNLGFDSQGQLLMLDYHDFKPLDVFLKKGRWSKIARCIMEFASLALFKRRFEEKFSESFTTWKEEAAIKSKNYAAEYFPSYIVNIFKALDSGRRSQIVTAITQCQKNLSNLQPVTASLQPIPKSPSFDFQSDHVPFHHHSQTQSPEEKICQCRHPHQSERTDRRRDKKDKKEKKDKKDKKREKSRREHRHRHDF